MLKIVQYGTPPIAAGEDRRQELITSLFIARRYILRPLLIVLCFRTLKDLDKTRAEYVGSGMSFHSQVCQ